MLSIDKFKVSMDDLNAGRTDADHYDAEDLDTYPQKWEIDDDVMQNFKTALLTIEKFIKHYVS